MQKPAATLADYTLTAKIFHWITAALFVAQFPIGFVMVQMGQGATADFLTSLHKSTGFFILWIALLRLLYRLRTSVVRRQSHLAGWHYKATQAAHFTLYALLILVPLTGWLGASALNSLELFGLVSLPSIMSPNDARAAWILWAHGLLAFGMLSLVAIHIGFALQGYLDGGTSPEESPAQPAPASSP